MQENIRPCHFWGGPGPALAGPAALGERPARLVLLCRHMSANGLSALIFFPRTELPLFKRSIVVDDPLLNLVSDCESLV